MKKELQVISKARQRLKKMTLKPTKLLKFKRNLTVGLITLITEKINCFISNEEGITGHIKSKTKT